MWPRIILVVALAGLALLYLLAANWFGEREGSADAHLFNSTPTEDKYKTTFHRQRFTWRSLALVLGCLVANSLLLLAPAGVWRINLVLSLLLWGAALWNYEFTTTLNIERKLPYVDEFYVSVSDKPNFWDRQLIRLAGYLGILPRTLLQRVLLWPIYAGWSLWIPSFLFFAYQTLSR